MIIPSVLESNHKVFNENLKKVLSLRRPKIVQIDFADGEFVATKTVPIEDLKPLSNRVAFEAHLMVKSPDNFEIYKKAGFIKVIVHYEAFESEAELEKALDKIKKLGMTPAIAISPSTSVSVLRYYTDTVNDFTLLGVVPGRQGQTMEPEAIHRLRELRDIAPHANLEMDGGVNEENIAALIDAGATECVSGSALLNGDIQTNYQKLLDALK